ncbi:MAG TPA: MoxR family ATPase [Longimicrobium sp.]|jgi:MoxR-like ATPase|uniref:AAA family ATPase n=1 Tax=Longimicrobium sp. TaxID=2029185 RepID=UPI002EDAB397
MSLPEYRGDQTPFYVAGQEVADTVNLAIHLRRPLLVEGEPGCGKTRLADSIAAELGLGPPVKISVKSTSRARDLLYRFNAIRRLQDAQDVTNQHARSIHPYLSLGPLGRAIQDERRAVVLIDEVDKADIDFPNDLLDVLDTFTFQVEDLPEEEEAESREKNGFGRTVTAPAGGEPIVVITSNREKRLPEPFLRRCLYVHLRFPERQEVLREIVRKNLQLTADEVGQELLDAAVEAFRQVRDASIAVDAQKPPTTSELIDWVKILHWKAADPASLRRPGELPPYWQALFKTLPDLEAYRKTVDAAAVGRE